MLSKRVSLGRREEARSNDGGSGQHQDARCDRSFAAHEMRGRGGRSRSNIAIGLA